MESGGQYHWNLQQLKDYENRLSYVRDLLATQQYMLKIGVANYFDNDDIVSKMKKIVPEFKSMNSSFELLDKYPYFFKMLYEKGCKVRVFYNLF